MDIFQNTPLGKYITGLSEEERGILFHCYVRDFLLLAMGVSCPEELKASIVISVIWVLGSKHMRLLRPGSCVLCYLPTIRAASGAS